MPWSWAVAADFQLYLLLPLYVVIYKKSRAAALGVAWGLFALGTVIICLVVYDFDLTAGAYTLENWYMYGMFLNKPYCKFQVHALGVLAAILYLDILAYRKAKAEDEEDAAKQYPKIHLAVTSKIFGIGMLLLGLGCIFTNLFISFACTKDPYAWSKGANMAFFSLTRSSYSLGWLLIAFYLILGHSPTGLRSLARPGFNAAGRLVYPAYLISPIIMMIVYCNTYAGTMMSMAVNVILGMGHMVIAFTVGFAIYTFIEWPMKCSIRIFLHPIFAHEDVLKIHNSQMNVLSKSL
jgi:peptidoglycan/LPS O-acetylase OafA/YrhL